MARLEVSDSDVSINDNDDVRHLEQCSGNTSPTFTPDDHTNTSYAMRMIFFKFLYNNQICNILEMQTKIKPPGSF
jgi:hypothetical protein